MKASDLSYIISSINTVCRELRTEQARYHENTDKYKILGDLQIEFDNLGCKTISLLSNLTIDFDIEPSLNE